MWLKNASMTKLLRLRMNCSPSSPHMSHFLFDYHALDTSLSFGDYYHFFFHFTLTLFPHFIGIVKYSFLQEQEDPFSLVADELSLVANRLRSMVVAEVSDFYSPCYYHFLLTK